MLLVLYLHRLSNNSAKYVGTSVLETFLNAISTRLDENIPISPSIIAHRTQELCAAITFGRWGMKRMGVQTHNTSNSHLIRA
jgi:hypothetical protein